MGPKINSLIKMINTMFDLGAYGNGLGLTILGFIIGVVLGVIFKVINKIGSI